jgi:hypothetical protein
LPNPEKLRKAIQKRLGAAPGSVGASIRADITFALNITLDRLGLTRHESSGKVENDQIVGTVKVTPANQSPMTMPWRARRSERSDYFARTGTKMFQQPVQDP